MGVVCGLLLSAGFFPLSRAWAAAEGSTVRHPLAWAFASWAAWCAAAVVGGPWLHWLALCLTACAGVAVLNARRPHAVAWHFVVAGLLVLLLRPFWEGLGGLRLEGPYVTALAAALGVGIGNYLPTRLGPAALLLAAWCGADLARLTGSLEFDPALGLPALAAVPWLGWLLVRRRPGPAFDAAWRTFRDRYGFVWAALTREMFNNAARNASKPFVLGWSGLRGEGAEEALTMLRAVTQRFEGRGREV